MGTIIDLTNGVTPEKVVRFEVPGEPRSKQRPRVTQRGTFTPKETIEAERHVRDCWRATGEQPFQDQLLVDITFYNGNRRRRDLDNMAKLVLDALNKEAYEDDVQVIELNVRKIFTERERARSIITLREMIEPPAETML